MSIIQWVLLFWHGTSKNAKYQVRTVGTSVANCGISRIIHAGHFSSAWRRLRCWRKEGACKRRRIMQKQGFPTTLLSLLFYKSPINYKTYKDLLKSLWGHTMTYCQSSSSTTSAAISQQTDSTVSTFLCLRSSGTMFSTFRRVCLRWPGSSALANGVDIHDPGLHKLRKLSTSLKSEN